MSQAVRIRSGQVVKLELNDGSVDALRAAWALYKAWHEDIHGCPPGYSEFISKLVVMAAAEINLCDERTLRNLLNTRIRQ